MDKVNGYILLFKQIQDNWLWTDKPFSKGQAWIDLLLMANFADGEMISKGIVVEIKRGQVFRTVKFLSDRWGWSTKKTKHFLQTLENQKMVATEGLSNGTRITIEKYDTFQVEGLSKDLSKDPRRDYVGTTRVPQKNKEKERINKENNNRRFAPPSVDDVKAYCQERKNKVNPEAFVDFYTSKNWMVGKNKMKDWRAAVRNWERMEAGRSRQDTSKSPTEPPKYKQFAPEPERKAEPMTAEQRANAQKILSGINDFVKEA